MPFADSVSRITCSAKRCQVDPLVVPTSLGYVAAEVDAAFLLVLIRPITSFSAWMSAANIFAVGTAVFFCDEGS